MDSHQCCLTQNLVDEVAYFFREFRILPDGIRPLGAEGQEQDE